MSNKTINHEKSKLSHKLKRLFSSRSSSDSPYSQPICYFPFPKPQPGFTIIELLIVIVIIGILAAITIVAYTGITNRATIASLQSDLTNSSKKLEAYYALYRSYPTMNGSNCPTAPTVNNDYCLKTSPNNILSYWVDNTSKPQSFRLTVSKDGYKYSNNENDLKCPPNFIVVPGSTTYGTADFCVMKYEAKQIGSSTTPISQASGTPWVNVNQELAGANNDAKEYSTNVTGCNDCHLITEAEWLTIAQNVLSVPSNWNGGVVGTSYIYRGHSDGTPNNALEASTDDTDGYYLAQNDTSGNQRRTLTLTNGEVIWDMAGNVHEWTAGQSTTGQPGITGEVTMASKEWNTVNAPGTLIPNPNPSFGTPAASGWTGTTNGIGKLFSCVCATSLKGFRRGGDWAWSSSAGIYMLQLDDAPTGLSDDVGFRVAR